MLRISLLVTAFLTLVFSACAISEYGEIPVGSVSQTEVTANALAFNRLAGNRLAGNSLASHNLAINRLVDGTLIASNLDGMEETESGRDLLTYIAQCALDDGDVLQATHAGTTYDFPGLLGLAPAWETQGIGPDEQEMVSACLIGHVNAFGKSVTLSARVIDTLFADAAERSEYRIYEGTFFGQVFVADDEQDPIYTYSCQGDDHDVAIAHNPTDRADRACTDGNEGCGDIVAVGRCRDVCDDYSDEYGWKSCRGGGVTYQHTMSVYLRDGDPDNANSACGIGLDCVSQQELSTENINAGTSAILSCRGSDDCTVRCEDDDICTLDGAQSTGYFTAYVESGATAKIDAYNAHDAAVSCDDVGNKGAECEVDCKAAGTCDLTCTNGASCLLECAGATSCAMSTCHEVGGASECGQGSGIWVCGRSCP